MSMPDMAGELHAEAQKRAQKLPSTLKEAGSTSGPPLGYSPSSDPTLIGNPDNTYTPPPNPSAPPWGYSPVTDPTLPGNPTSGARPTPGASPTSTAIPGNQPPAPTPTINDNNGINQLVDSWANSVGLGSLSGWINGQISALAGEGLSASDIASTIQNTINSAPGFDQLMPGYNQRIKNGFTNTDSSTGAGIAGYLAYRQQVNAMAETAGLAPGTITATDVGNSWANDVSTNELSDRITTEYVNAIHALPQIQSELQNYGYVQGITPGQLASYYINPDKTVAQLQTEFNAATAGGEGVLTGFGEIGQSKAYALQAFLSNGGQNNLSAPQAANFFTANVGNGLNSLSQMAQTGFEQAQLGTSANGPGVVSQDQLLSAGEGNASALQSVTRAAQTRASDSAGGGGAASTQQGVQGIGFGSA